MIEYIANKSDNDPEIQRIIKMGIAKERVMKAIAFEIIITVLVVALIIFSSILYPIYILFLLVVPYFISGFFSFIGFILFFFTDPRYVWKFFLANFIVFLTFQLFFNSMSGKTGFSW